ncbi:DUF3995 domain-containing protein [Sphingobacterium sp. PCS056]|jgi:uncharacterized membrane protein YuzA (DUF378 family)|uniref:DUF3995 domain-containing protein n=1 Tax=Sphingobacterium TaxID=28453 RepID=UPI00200EA105|nr:MULTISPECIES: DUF3995 domain-containing protein [Sphingobacterium]UPZ34650.1 DUF3995 domain-containing protein [Sphingobacterium sp. PCS056]UXD70265.1 DUF3995 domain-containing protein [Sphingobacterium faecium]
MDYILSIANSVIFLFLALMHLYWVCNGQVGIAATIPTKLNGKRVFTPSRFGTFVVAAGLFMFAVTNLIFGGMIESPIGLSYINYAMWGIAGIFLIRFIGDFKYVGITKRFRQSVFAQKDTFFYSPLCFLLAVSHAILLMD